MNTDNKAIKENLKEYYNRDAELRNSRPKADWKTNFRANFYDLVVKNNKKTLLELGAGVGHDSQYFMEKGLSVVAVDISENMVNKCKEKGLEAYVLDFYNLSSLNKKFDCIYAMNSILHTPKNDLPLVLKEIGNVLNSNGLFYLGLYGGEDNEHEFIREEVSKAPRFFATHSTSYLREILNDYFDIISFEAIDVQKEGNLHKFFYSVTLSKKG